MDDGVNYDGSWAEESQFDADAAYYMKPPLMLAKVNGPITMLLNMKLLISMRGDGFRT